MNTGRTIFSQLMDYVPFHEFCKCVKRYNGDRKVKSFSCWEQFLCMSFAQLTYRESLRAIQESFRAVGQKLYHMGIRGRVSRNTLANANQVRSWRIYADFAQGLIQTARKLYAKESFGIELTETVYALDATIIDLCLSLFPWARFRKRKGAVKLHTLLDLMGSIPLLIVITHGKIHDVNILDDLFIEAGAIYIMDRGYLDFARLYKIHTSSAFFIIRAKSNFKFRRLYSLPTANRRKLRSAAQSSDNADRLLYKTRLPGKTSSYPLLRCNYEQIFCIPDKQFQTAGTNDRKPVSLSLARGVVLQVDQTASSDQGILWNIRERCEDSNMDRDFNLRAGCHRKEAIE